MSQLGLIGREPFLLHQALNVVARIQTKMCRQQALACLTLSNLEMEGLAFKLGKSADQPTLRKILRKCYLPLMQLRALLPVSLKNGDTVKELDIYRPLHNKDDKDGLNRPPVGYVKLANTTIKCTPSYSGLTFSNLGLAGQTNNIIRVDLGHILYMNEHHAHVRSITVSRDNRLKCYRSMENPFFSKALLPTEIVILNPSRTKFRPEDKISIRFTPSISPREMTLAETNLVPKEATGVIHASTLIQTIRDLKRVASLKKPPEDSTDIWDELLPTQEPNPNNMEPIARGIQCHNLQLCETQRVRDPPEDFREPEDYHQILFPVTGTQTSHHQEEEIPGPHTQKVGLETSITNTELDNDNMNTSREKEETNPFHQQIQKNMPQGQYPPMETLEPYTWEENYEKNMREPFPHKKPSDLPVLTDDQQESVFHSIFFPNKTITKIHLITLQRLDDHFGNIMDNIDENRDYTIKQGVLVYQPSPEQSPRLAIPRSMAPSLYKSLHQEHCHTSPDTTRRLFDKFYYANKFDAKPIHRTCMVCAVTRTLRPEPRLGNKRTLRPTAPRQVLFIDVKDSIRPRSHGYRHVLVCIDAFSQYIYLIPLYNKSAPHMARRFQQEYLNHQGPLISIYSDNANSYLAEFRKTLAFHGIETQTGVPESQKSDFAEAAIRIVGQKLTKLLSDPEFDKSHRDWPTLLPSLARTINRTPLKRPFANFTREQIHFGNQTNHHSPLAIKITQETMGDIEIPYREDIGQYDAFAEHLKMSNKSAYDIRENVALKQQGMRQDRHDKERSKPRQIDHRAIPHGSLVFLTDKYHKKDRPSTFHGRRKLFRVLETTQAGVTAQSLSDRNEIKTIAPQHLEYLNPREYDEAYPQEFWGEITALSRDWYKRPHRSTDSLEDKLSRRPDQQSDWGAPEDPEDEMDEGDDGNEPPADIDAPEEDQRPQRRSTRDKERVDYSKM